ncbi:hypothetical protein EJ04DRAFT_272774 [Polyplosphaeria fusca]|uniref:Uncharacterized protein n=1 Tax=Polyplosphaeria fusca TaxID=682080 RepID=A0A9P4V1Q4_9PLEO|nr:hypothetical protein EJ04DRAFT_272774 [Polyplosphaeria fusca]
MQFTVPNGLSRTLAGKQLISPSTSMSGQSPLAAAQMARLTSAGLVNNQIIRRLFPVAEAILPHLACSSSLDLGLPCHHHASEVRRLSRCTGCRLA